LFKSLFDTDEHADRHARACTSCKVGSNNKNGGNR
jgi:hypothetical protein